jgi:HK97 family phage prohead protease
MPWKTRSDHPDCSGVAVVKSDTGALVACHQTQAEADAHVKALYANTGEESRTENAVAEFRDMEIKGRSFRGVAAVFDTPWNDALTEAMGYVETIAKGAFTKALARGDNIPLLGAHRRHELLATTDARTLTLAQSGKGLEVEADLPKNYLGDYYREMMHRGDLRGMSYGFETRAGDNIMSRQDGVMHRTIANFQRLLDVTLTWEPAYPATEVELRAAGLVVAPLQQIIGDVETSPDEGATVPPPDSSEAEATWEPLTPAEAEPQPTVPRKWWERRVDALFWED